MTDPRPLGIDPSLTATGMSDGTWARTLKPPKGLAGVARIRWIVEQAQAAMGSASCVVIEGPSYGSKGGSDHERGGLWWRLADVVDLMGLDLVVVPPTVLKKFATGRGNADKDAVMLATARRFDWFDGDNNAADALWLAALGHQLEERPICALPAGAIEALPKVDVRVPTP